MKNTKDNGAPVVLRLQKHYGSTGKWRLRRDEYTNSEMKYLTEHIMGYYRSDEGVINKAIDEAKRWEEGDYMADGSGTPRPVQIDIYDKGQLDEELREEIPDKFLDQLKPLTPEGE